MTRRPDDRSARQLWNQVGELVSELDVLALCVVQLVAETAKTSAEPEQWLRRYADRLYAALDRLALPSADFMPTLEASRARIDTIVTSVELRLKD